MGGLETPVQAGVEPSLKYHPEYECDLTWTRETGPGTVLAGQFDWGGLLQKSNGGVQRSVQHGWKPCDEYKNINRLYCETHESSSHESGP